MKGSYTGYMMQRARESAHDQIEREKWLDTQVGRWDNKPIYQVRRSTSENKFEVYIRYVDNTGKIREAQVDNWLALREDEAERLVTALTERATNYWRGKKYVTPLPYQETGIQIWG